MAGTATHQKIIILTWPRVNYFLTSIMDGWNCHTSENNHIDWNCTISANLHRCAATSLGVLADSISSNAQACQNPLLPGFVETSHPSLDFLHDVRILVNLQNPPWPWVTLLRLPVPPDCVKYVWNENEWMFEWNGNLKLSYLKHMLQGKKILFTVFHRIEHTVQKYFVVI